MRPPARSIALHLDLAEAVVLEGREGSRFAAVGDRRRRARNPHPPRGPRGRRSHRRQGRGARRCGHGRTGRASTCRTAKSAFSASRPLVSAPNGFRAGKRRRTFSRHSLLLGVAYAPGICLAPKQRERHRLRQARHHVRARLRLRPGDVGACRQGTSSAISESSCSTMSVTGRAISALILRSAIRACPAMPTTWSRSAIRSGWRTPCSSAIRSAR